MNKKNIASSFDSWLREEDIQEEVTTGAIKRVLPGRCRPRWRKAACQRPRWRGGCKPAVLNWTVCWTPKTNPSLCQRSKRRLPPSAARCVSNWSDLHISVADGRSTR